MVLLCISIIILYCTSFSTVNTGMCWCQSTSSCTSCLVSCGLNQPCSFSQPTSVMFLQLTYASHIVSNSHSFALTHLHSPSLTLTHPHPHPHLPSLALIVTLTHPHSPSPSLTLTLTHPHSPSLTLTHPHSPSLTLTHPHSTPLYPTAISHTE